MSALGAHEAARVSAHPLHIKKRKGTRRNQSTPDVKKIMLANLADDLVAVGFVLFGLFFLEKAHGDYILLLSDKRPLQCDKNKNNMK